MYQRELEQEARAIAVVFPIVTILGPRQFGKTTLVRKVFVEKPYVNLENLMWGLRRIYWALKQKGS